MAKLALYFSSNAIPRMLDTDLFPIGKEWRIGRPTNKNKPDIAFSKDTVSRLHAIIRCIDEYEREQWQIKHCGHNGTYRARHGVQRVLPYGEWVNIRDDDRFIFATQAAMFRATTAIEETLEAENDETPTVNKTLEEAIAEHKRAKSSSADHWIVELARLLLNGPKGFPNWLWWLILLVSVLAYVALKYG